MGPTLTFVKANDGHIFGGFNPTSWVSEFLYNETEDAYLFSVTDGKGRYDPLNARLNLIKRIRL
jgi:hypothetical protein